MPILGHTFIGVVVAREIGPDALASTRTAGPWTRALWVPAIVTLSYLPDVLTQCGIWLQWPWARAAGHSVLVACVLGAVIGGIWSRLTMLPFGRLAALATGVIALHDVVDLFQDAERTPFWPFSMRPAGVDWLMFTDRLVGELAVFGVPFAAYLVWQRVRRRSVVSEPSSSAGRWVTGAFVCAVLVVSLGIVHLRQERQTQMDRAEALLRSGRLEEALATIDAAEQWPSSPGRGDLLRGRVYVRMGRDDQAEAVFLRAHDRAPNTFWPTAVLAEFYASRGPIETRRARSAPYIETLRARFSGWEAFGRVMERIEQHLNDSNR